MLSLRRLDALRAAYSLPQADDLKPQRLGTEFIGRRAFRHVLSLHRVNSRPSSGRRASLGPRSAVKNACKEVGAAALRGEERDADAAWPAAEGASGDEHEGAACAAVLMLSRLFWAAHVS